MSEGGDISRLIGELGADLKPVRPLPPPWVRTLVWLAVVAVVAALLVATRNLLPALDRGEIRSGRCRNVHGLMPFLAMFGATPPSSRRTLRSRRESP